MKRFHILAIAASTVFVATAPALANPVYQGGGTSAVSFGVTGFGAPGGFGPTFIANNFTGRIDILSNPGGGSSTFFPTIPNNTREFVGGVPTQAAWQGGGNVNGPFGTSTLRLNPTTFQFSMADSPAAVPGQSGSYVVASSIATFAEPVGFAGAIGNTLAISGMLPLVGSDAVVGLRTFISSANPASPFFGGLDLPHLVLGLQRVTAGGTYAGIGFGGFGPIAGFGNVVVTNPFTGAFRGLAANSLNVVIPAGDLFTVSTTLTVLADPSSIGSVELGDVADLAPQGFALPQYALGSSVGVVPEPATQALLLLGLALTVAAGKRRRI